VSTIRVVSYFYEKSRVRVSELCRIRVTCPCLCFLAQRMRSHRGGLAHVGEATPERYDLKVEMRLTSISITNFNML